MENVAFDSRPGTAAIQAAQRKKNHMSQLAEGIWGCTVMSASFGENDKNIPRIQINVRLDDGPNAGRQTTYEDEVNARSAPYVARSAKAVGWKGADLSTLHDDCAAWMKATGGKSTAEIKHIPIKTGKRVGEIWDKCNSIGRGAKPLQPARQATLDDANEAVRRAMAEDGGGDVYDQHPSDDKIPFATCSSVSTGEVARVLRGAL